MNQKIKNVTHQDMKLAYEVYGEGEHIILCFHGNGRTASDFEFLATKGRKVISVHLFLHGFSTFDSERIHKNLITDKDVKKLLEKLLKKEKVETFHWVAYSQGGRFTLSTFHHFADRVQSLNLIAPDGLNNSNFYSWSQHRWWARMLFRRWIKKPKELMLIAKALAKVKIIHPKIVSFLEFYTSDPEKFKMSYKTWSAFRQLRPNSTLIKQSLNNNKIPFKIIIGEYDKIITAKSAIQFLKKVEQPKALHKIPYGHDIFKPHILEKLFTIMTFEDYEK
ncbi:alpha/beta fold hydrolase [Brumimicrobium aurantiacum]|uniref:Alpha/beta hydrolase n=1 Tax=Brumimicrobium aurantiacum TaxID=1737063 RepID=A0A3E1EWR7_9FLAO|nr:alpha/beta hydrolase [Brumimicrobium aurantiacum]RFC54001.1 alpha/beta hydrolase [Brumimicrobium aurantiacum]